MAVPNAAFRYGVRFSSTSYVLRVEFDTAEEDLTFPATGSLDPAVDYFFLGDGTAADLCEILADTVATHTGISACTVTLDVAGRELEVDATGVSGSGLEILWSHANTTLDATIFGWTNTADSGLEDNVVISPNLPMGLIFMDRPVTTDSRPRQGTVGGTSRTVSGNTRTSRIAVPLKERGFTADLLLETLALDEYAPATEPYATFESMYVRALFLGHSVHYIPDDSDMTVYSVLKLAPPLRDMLSRDSRYFLRWANSLKFVTVSEVT